MDIALWIAAGFMAFVFVSAGSVKAFMPIAQTKKMPWAQELTALQIRGIGTAEVLGAIGLIVPQATNIAPILTPIAATLLAVLMAGATSTHLRLSDPRSAAVTTRVLMGVLLFVAAGRFAGLLNLF